MEQHTHNSAPPRPQPAPPGATFFNAVRSHGLYRTSDRWLGGVAGGIAAKWNIDPILARCITGILLLFTGVGWIAYAAAWALLPEERDGRIHAQELLRGVWAGAYVGIGLFVVIGMGWGGSWLLGPTIFGFGGLGWIGTTTGALLSLALVAGAIVYGIKMWQEYSTRHPKSPATPGGTPTDPYPGGYPMTDTNAHTESAQQEPAAQEPLWQQPAGQAYVPPTPPVPPVPPRPPAPRWRSLPGPAIAAILGVALLLIAGLLLASQGGLIDGNLSAIATGSVLILFGTAMIVAGAFSRRAGAIGAFAAVVLIFCVPFVAWNQVTTGLNDPTVIVASDSDLSPSVDDSPANGYVFIASDADLDLSDLVTNAERPLTIPVRATMSDLTITLPAGVSAEVDAKWGFGDLSWQRGQSDSLTSSPVNTKSLKTLEAQEGEPVSLYLEVRSGLGSVTIKEQP